MGEQRHDEPSGSVAEGEGEAIDDRSRNSEVKLTCDSARLERRLFTTFQVCRRYAPDVRQTTSACSGWRHSSPPQLHDITGAAGLSRKNEHLIECEFKRPAFNIVGANVDFTRTEKLVTDD